MNRSWNRCSVQPLTVRRGKAPRIETPMSERAISRRIDDKLIRVLREKREAIFPSSLCRQPMWRKSARRYARCMRDLLDSTLADCDSPSLSKTTNLNGTAPRTSLPLCPFIDGESCGYSRSTSRSRDFCTRSSVPRISKRESPPTSSASYLSRRSRKIEESDRKRVSRSRRAFASFPVKLPRANGRAWNVIEGGSGTRRRSL